ncbi:unnamed protein product [Ceratitis capitata]|uniref:(Mediterranean fruit fly) hypothetical protein n=1 Tax=Ceratitis capitata TaxID=7213 RepID=A0A811V889_CERCA|nr:unnamed protein product [Ceratitis capitata]
MITFELGTSLKQHSGKPVGSVPPKMNLLEKVRTMQVPQASTYAMQCPGQAFPVPIVRYVIEREAFFVRKCQAIKSYETSAVAVEFCATLKVLRKPLGAVPPKILNIHDKFLLMQVKLAQSFSMQCPGQAFPVPIVRYLKAKYFSFTDIKIIEQISIWVYRLTPNPSIIRAVFLHKPIGSVPPKVTSLHDKFQVLQVKQGHEFSMQCPGQAYPVPIVSVAPKVDTRDEFTFARTRLHTDKALICPAQSYPVPEPVGSVAPKVDPNDRIKWVDKPVGTSLNLLCPSQSYPVPVYSVAPKVDVKDRINWLDKPLEPVGSVAPKVDINDKVKVAFKRQNSSLSLICPAQAYPMPAFRQSWVDHSSYIFHDPLLDVI